MSKRAEDCREFAFVRDYPTSVRVIAYDGLGRKQVDEVFVNGWAVLAAFKSFNGGTVYCYDAVTNAQIGYVMRG